MTTWTTNQWIDALIAFLLIAGIAGVGWVARGFYEHIKSFNEPNKQKKS